MSNLWTVFLTGLFTGGLTCLAVQGGLLTATITQQEKKDRTAFPILVFLFAKLCAYTILGLLLGWFGSLFQLSIAAQISMQLLVAIFMLGTAFNILEVHPVFRYFALQPPRFITRLVRNKSKSKTMFAPAVLGAFTVFIPCGTTQAMMALAIGSGNPISGAAIMFAFILGTSPLFFALGFFATKLSGNMHSIFMKLAAILLILLSFYTLNNVFALSGSPFSLTPKKNPATQALSDTVTINIEKYGYSPDTVTVKTGSTVTFNIVNSGIYTCAAAFTIPYFDYQKVVEAGKTETIALQMPERPTQIPFMCSMGMYRGVINVVN